MLSATGRSEELGLQDVVIVATKAHVLPPAAEALQTLIGADRREIGFVTSADSSAFATSACS